VLIVALLAALLTASGAAAAVGSSGGTSTAPPTGTGGGIAVPDPVDRAVAKGPTDVLVSFDPSAGVQQLRSATAHGPSASARSTGISAASASYAQSKRDALQRAGDGVEARKDYDHLPLQLVRVDDQGALQRLASDPHVVGLSLPQTYRLVASANLEMIHQPAAVAAGHTGAGVTVAVLDSGIDLAGHNGSGIFGSCSGGAGAAACRVKVATNVQGTGDLDTQQFHGTNVAGVVATVAPAAKIDDYGVFRKDAQGDLTASDTDINGAINTVVGTAASHNVRAVNLSLAGTDKWHTTECKTNNSFTSTFQSLAAAGIVPVVAAGNDAYTASILGPSFHDGVSEPACTPNALSVGAVYHTGLGQAQYQDCTDNNPQPKQIACFSQSGALLGVLAPGVQITAAGIQLTGTSQATPHVSAAIADIIDAKPDATEAQLFSAITGSGQTITDPRNGVTKHLLDITAAATFLTNLGTTTTTSTSTTSTTTTTTTPTTAPTTSPSSTSPTTQPSGTPADVVRVSGSDRIATAIVASQSSFPTTDSAGAVVLASSQAFPDGLAGTPLAVHLHAPLLLTDPGSVRNDVLAEIQRVLPNGGPIKVLGGSSAVSDDVVTALTSAGFQVGRIAGADRYATAAAIADQISSPQVVLLATGLNFPDGLTAGVAAAHGGGVVLFTQGTGQAAATQTWLNAHAGMPVVTVGGPAASAFTGGTHLSGADRYETSVKVAEHFFSGPHVAGLASGTVFPDALSGGAHLGPLGGPMLLTQPGSLPSTVGSWFSANGGSLTRVDIYGGPSAVAENVANQVRTATT
jgi:putative cell wall-binding protein